MKEKTNINITSIREAFPILKRKVNGKNLIYLDNAASSQKPLSVIDAISEYYSNEHSNVHRGVHYLSQLATEKFEIARSKISTYINAAETRELIFTKGTTDSINLVANSLGRTLQAGDEVLITEMEHHSNIVPWQIAVNDHGAKLVVARIHDDGSLDLEDFYKKLSPKTRISSLVHISNALGTINPIKEIAKAVHEYGGLLLVDGAQSAHHMKVDVQKLNCDFYVGSGHKMYGPTGIGFLYGKAHLLEKMHPYQSGGEMIADVTFEKTTYQQLPFKFEAGTPNISGAIGLGAAVDFIQSIGIEKITEAESELLNYIQLKLSEVDGIRFIGTAKEKAGVVSFLIDGVHPYDIGAIIDKMGVAVRTGHHCTQPLMKRLNIPGTVRASLAVYNSKQDIDILTESVIRASKMLRK